MGITQLPGKAAQEAMAAYVRWVPRALSPLVPMVIERGEGAVIYTADGRRYLDFTGGVGCLNVGHCHPRVVEAIRQQAERFLHTDVSVVPYSSYTEVCRRLCELAPGKTPKKAMLLNAGTEAVENAVKIARKVTGRPALISFEGGFHGRTYMSLSLTSRVDPYKAGFGPFMPEVYRVPFPYPYRGITTDQTMQALERLFRTAVPPKEVAAVVVEPIQGEGGYVITADDFLPRLREVCDRYGMLLIVDEIQTGMGRTGRWWACQHTGIEPDLMAVGKSLAAGLPLSGVVGKAEWLDGPAAGELGGTYIGNPVACAAALAVLAVIEEEKLLERAGRLGALLMERLNDMAGRFPVIGDVRGRGAMVAMELVTDPRSKEPARDVTRALLQRVQEHGLVVLAAGVHGNVIRFPIPLVLDERQLQDGCDKLEKSLSEVVRR